MPVAIDAPMFSGSALTSTPESCSACRAAASTSCTKRSMRRAALRSIQTVGSKSFSSQAKCTGIVARVELRDRAGARLAGDERAPGRLEIVSERADHAHAGDDDAPPAVSVFAHLHPQSAVDEQHLARDERGLVGAEEPYRPRDVLRLAEPAERRVGRASPASPPPAGRR